MSYCCLVHSYRILEIFPPILLVLCMQLYVSYTTDTCSLHGKDHNCMIPVLFLCCETCAVFFPRLHLGWLGWKVSWKTSLKMAVICDIFCNALVARFVGEPSLRWNGIKWMKHFHFVFSSRDIGIAYRMTLNFTGNVAKNRWKWESRE